MSVNTVTVNATAANTFSSWGLFRAKFNLSISGTWAGTATVQRKFGSTGTTVDVDAFVSNKETYGIEAEDDVYYRVGIKAGEYTSGTMAGRVSQ